MVGSILWPLCYSRIVDASPKQNLGRSPALGAMADYKPVLSPFEASIWLDCVAAGTGQSLRIMYAHLLERSV